MKVFIKMQNLNYFIKICIQSVLHILMDFKIMLQLII